MERGARDAQVAVGMVNSGARLLHMNGGNIARHALGQRRRNDDEHLRDRRQGGDEAHSTDEAVTPQ